MNCPTCATGIERVEVVIDPKRAERLFVTQCGHRIDVETARTAYSAGLMPRPKFPEVNAATLAVAERQRQVEEEGHTPERDAELDPHALPWAVWCLLDRADALGRRGNPPPEQAPAVWPLPRSDFPQDKTPLRLLIIATALMLAEIDRRLQAGERP